MLNQCRSILMFVAVTTVCASICVENNGQPIYVHFNGDGFAINGQPAQQNHTVSHPFYSNKNPELWCTFSETPWWAYLWYAFGGYVLGSVWLEAEAEAIKSADWATWITADVHHLMLEHEIHELLRQVLEKEPRGLLLAVQQIDLELARITRLYNTLFYLNLFQVRRILPRYKYLHALVEHYQPRLQLLQETIQTWVHEHERELVLGGKPG